MGKLVIFSAPSGAGKSTIVGALLKQFPELEFSISATSRAPRGTEQHGKEYYFLTADEFRAKIASDSFVEWEEVYAGSYYGTLRSEMDRIWAKDNVVAFDVDVMGGIRLKELFGEQACSVFVMPPSVEELERRLIGRATDAPEVIAKRVAKAASEIEKAPAFDHIVVNDDLQIAINQAADIVRNFIKG